MAVVAETRSKCHQCGGSLSWSPKRSLLKCDQCGSEKSLDFHGEKVCEIPLSQAAMSVVPRQTTEFLCGACGARTQGNEADVGRNCAFCGSPQLVSGAATDGIPPQGVLPFKLEKGEARQAFSTWIMGLWFRPNDLKKLAQVSGLKGIYVPYWTFDATAYSRWQAERGYYYYETEHENGEDKKVQKVRWEYASGSRSDEYDDILVCASKGLEREYADKFATFKTNECMPMRDEILAGWVVERYAVPLEDGWNFASHRMESSQEMQCARDVGGDTHRHFSVVTQFSNETYKHILLPIWHGVFTYQGKSFEFYVNAQTGEVHGKAPWSVIKITLAVIFCLTILFAVIYAKK